MKAELLVALDSVGYCEKVAGRSHDEVLVVEDGSCYLLKTLSYLGKHVVPVGIGVRPGNKHSRLRFPLGGKTKIIFQN